MRKILVYDAKTKQYAEEYCTVDPPGVEEIPEPEPTQEERMEAQVLYTALMTDTLLEV